METATLSQPVKFTEVRRLPFNIIHGTSRSVADIKLAALNDWVSSMDRNEYELLELLVGIVRKNDEDQVMGMLENSTIAKLAFGVRKSFKLIKGSSFKLV